MKFIICVLLLIICMVKLNEAGGAPGGGCTGGRGGNTGGWTKPTTVVSCSNRGAIQACCNGLLNCVVQLLGKNCGKNSQTFLFYS